MVVTACPCASFWTTPNSGIGAVGWTRMMPMNTRSHRPRERLRCCDMDQAHCAMLVSVASLWSRISAALDLGARQQITRAGLLFTAACLLVGLAAFASANN